ncbi:hypothetical protein M430DRAFT_167848 [Amorphotheca resinae ATCC 22711]|uniref:Uncharacterized protein n=1 Tax=Amorphotheca resinae ATCC 22711 TaxID=857342 RepID=A0A2T3AU56_AMORE|nr:hypothetical protein M430DRAFT_167848 [Amorphotheca resinae ATCC 22711]PSS12184.1 hypothetical protein M430DRAFT_167848 [Amorphotheca resinae ATCC 22711]
MIALISPVDLVCSRSMQRRTVLLLFLLLLRFFLCLLSYPPPSQDFYVLLALGAPFSCPARSRCDYSPGWVVRLIGSGGKTSEKPHRVTLRPRRTRPQDLRSRLAISPDRGRRIGYWLVRKPSASENRRLGPSSAAGKRPYHFYVNLAFSSFIPFFLSHLSLPPLPPPICPFHCPPTLPPSTCLNLLMRVCPILLLPSNLHPQFLNPLCDIYIYQCIWPPPLKPWRWC